MKSIPRSLCLTLLLAIGLLSTASGANVLALDSANSNAITEEAVVLFKQGRLAEAQEIEDAAIKRNPSDWLSHATKSYFFWHEGNVPDAIAEGQKAVRFGPENAVALTNLGHIYQQLGGYRDAIPLYDNACRSAPDDWVSRISLAQAYVGADRPEEALNVLQTMAAKNSNDFAWNYQLGISYLTLEKPALAMSILDKAVEAAASPEQKIAAETDLLVALIQANELRRAAALEPTVLAVTNRAEPFVRAAAALLSASSPEAGNKLLQSALSNLNGAGASEAFFRLGRVFESKAWGKGKDNNFSAAWLELSRRAYTQAADLDPGAAKNHLGLASVLERQANQTAMVKELGQATMFVASDSLAPFLAAHQKNGVDLIAVNFQIPTLSCNCHAGKIENSLRSMSGISLIALSHLKPYSGVMLADPSAVKIDSSLSQCLEKVFELTPVLKEVTPPITFSLISQEPIKSVSDAVSIYQRVICGDVLDFPRRFDPIQLSLPQPQVAERNHSGL
ncbi:MAG: tetratricopeptide repeat protein [Cyanobacteria bacterium REEB67]|nr:tetratricopeptide repeat protein [Cyanobacteria bacterium REEB67]